jgi:hypothetical protein
MNQLAQTRDFIEGTEKIHDVATIKGFEAIFNNVVSISLGLGGIVLFVLLLSGGFKYITAGGDPKAIEGAKKTITYAIAGIVLLALAFLIIRLIEQITGAPVTQFVISR